MNKKQFEKLKVGDTVILNGQCRQNAGIKCKVTCIFENRVWIKPITGERELEGAYVLSPENEISYKAANVL